MATASALESMAWPRCLSQYCITMAMLAAPQPSFSCLIKGTSSHTPGVTAQSVARKAKPQRHKIATSLCGIERSMEIVLTDRHNNQDQHGNAQNDQDQVAFAEIAGGKISLRPVRTHCELGQFLIAQCGNGCLHLLRIQLGG